MKKYREQARESHERRLNSLTGGKMVEPRKPVTKEANLKAGGVVEGSHHEIAKHGGKPKARLDRYARGGKVKDKGKTTVNIVIAGDKGGAPAAPMPAPPPGAGAPPALPPKPPVALPPQGPVPGQPPIQLARKHGGRVSHPDEAQDKKLIRKMVKPEDLKRARGGRVGKFTAGAGSGEGRIEKTEHARARA